MYSGGGEYEVQDDGSTWFCGDVIFVEVVDLVKILVQSFVALVQDFVSFSQVPHTLSMSLLPLEGGINKDNQQSIQ